MGTGTGQCMRLGECHDQVSRVQRAQGKLLLSSKTSTGVCTGVSNLYCKPASNVYLHVPCRLGLIEVLADELVEACHAHLDEWADQQHGSRLQQPAQHQLSGDSQGEQQAEPHQHCTHTSHDLTLQGPELTPVVAGEGGEQSAQPAAAGLPEPFGSDTDGPGSSVGSDAEAASQTMGVPSQAAALQPQQLVSLLCTLLDDTWHYLSHVSLSSVATAC